MRRKDLVGPGREPPVLQVKWYDLTRWILEKVDSFPKSQRFVFGTRLAEHTIDVLETLVKASYSCQLTTELRLSRGMLRFRRRGWVRDQERASPLSGAVELVDLSTVYTTSKSAGFDGVS